MRFLSLSLMLPNKASQNLVVSNDNNFVILVDSGGQEFKPSTVSLTFPYLQCLEHQLRRLKYLGAEGAETGRSVSKMVSSLTRLAS